MCSTATLNLSVVMGASLSRGLVKSHVDFASQVLSELSSAGVLNCSEESEACEGTIGSSQNLEIETNGEANNCNPFLRRGGW